MSDVVYDWDNDEPFDSEERDAKREIYNSARVVHELFKDG